MVNATRNSTFGNPGAVSSETPQGTEGEAHAGGHHEQPRDLPPPPPPENLTMAQFLQALREERQASNAAIQQLTQVLVDNPPWNGNGAYTSSSTCVDTNHVEEIKELKAQVTSLKKDLEKSHEGMSTLNNVLCGRKSPNDKNGLGFNSNKKKKSKSFKKKGQEQVKNLAKIICFK
ncbi:hypothetical protein D1007_45548 [Hordeum vulgare]|nr:hypothetical protein D1007_45548 [Hordeum vulgare]